MDWREKFIVKPGDKVNLEKWDPDATPDGKDKDKAEEATAKHLKELAEQQYKLYADNTRSVLVVLQALDAGGKDGVINHVFISLNPQGCRVQSFKQPSREEAAHDFLWRAHKAVPQRGEFVIFNRSHYERVLVERVQKLIPPETVEVSYGFINDFERLMIDNGTVVLKFFLNISKEEQLKRFIERLDDPAKHWKISEDDYVNRQYWGDYRAAFEDAMERCSTAAAPWYIIPSNHKYYRDLAISGILVETMRDLNLQLPAPRANIDEIRKLAIAEVASQKR